MSRRSENAFAEQYALASVALALADAMEQSGVTQRELAKRLGVSEARVSQILGAEHGNLTVKSLGRIAHALGLRFVFRLEEGRVVAVR